MTTGISIKENDQTESFTWVSIGKLLKGTVPRDFRLQVLFMNQLIWPPF
jgi:hypothetical protein